MKSSTSRSAAWLFTKRKRTRQGRRVGRRYCSLARPRRCCGDAAYVATRRQLSPLSSERCTPRSSAGHVSPGFAMGQSNGAIVLGGSGQPSRSCECPQRPLQCFGSAPFTLWPRPQISLRLMCLDQRCAYAIRPLRPAAKTSPPGARSSSMSPISPPSAASTGWGSHSAPTISSPSPRPPRDPSRPHDRADDPDTRQSILPDGRSARSLGSAGCGNAQRGDEGESRDEGHTPRLSIRRARAE
jgi:hypothetical protein